MGTKQAESLLQQNQPALAGFVSLDPDFESGEICGSLSSGRQEPTTDPRSVSTGTKQAKSLLLQN